jgi:hypothetical protein
MRERIWVELTQTKHDSEFLALYSDRQRTILRWFNISILIFSTGGVMGWPVWDKFPIIACVIIALVSLLRLLQPHIIMTDKLLNDLDRINVFCADKYNQLERLWFDFDASRIDETEASNRFYKILETGKDLTSIIDETIRQKPKLLVKKAKEYSDIYFKQVFNTFQS